MEWNQPLRAATGSAQKATLAILQLRHANTGGRGREPGRIGLRSVCAIREVANSTNTENRPNR
eukprot:2841102-Alexandrium_andersonii.AAC.1